MDGRLRFISFNAQLFDDKASNQYAPSGFYWKSVISEDSQAELKTEIQRLISLLGLKTSLYNIETRECTDGRSYIMECSPRGGGNRISECLEMATGEKLIENAVRAAVGMDVLNLEQKPYDGYWAEAILHSDRAGFFEDLVVMPAIEKFIVDMDLWVSKGEKISCFTGADKAVGTMILRFSNCDEMEEMMIGIRDHVQIRVR